MDEYRVTLVRKEFGQTHVYRVKAGSVLDAAKQAEADLTAGSRAVGWEIVGIRKVERGPR